MIELQGISLELSDRKGSKTQILEQMSFSVPAGERFAILGPSGAGKSSVLRLLNRLQEPTSGRILVGGEDIKSIDVLELRRKCSMVLQQPVPLPGTVEDNLLVGPRLRRADIEAARKKIPDLLDRVHLESGLTRRNAEDLSVGQQHRVALARALMNDPEILLLDEPTSALDPPTAKAILDLVSELSRNLGLTLVMVTHSLAQALRVATSGLVIIKGQLRAVGAMETLQGHGDQEVAAFLSSEDDLSTAGQR